MTKERNSIASFFFGCPGFGRRNAASIAGFVERYPYSVAARILQMQKLQNNGAGSDLDEQLFTTSLYLNNSLPLKRLVFVPATNVSAPAFVEKLNQEKPEESEKMAESGRSEFETGLPEAA